MARIIYIRGRERYWIDEMHGSRGVPLKNGLCGVDGVVNYFNSDDLIAIQLREKKKLIICIEVKGDAGRELQSGLIRRVNFNRASIDLASE